MLRANLTTIGLGWALSGGHLLAPNGDRPLSGVADGQMPRERPSAARGMRLLRTPRVVHAAVNAGCSEETLPRSPGPTPLQVSPVQLPVRNRENLSPAAGRADEVSLRSSSCRSLRPSDLRPGQSGRRLPPSLDIPPGYTRGIGIAAGLLAVHIRHMLRQAILR
jgi:hypothetical protein